MPEMTLGGDVKGFRPPVMARERGTSATGKMQQGSSLGVDPDGGLTGLDESFEANGAPLEYLLPYHFPINPFLKYLSICFTCWCFFFQKIREDSPPAPFKPVPSKWIRNSRRENGKKAVRCSIDVISHLLSISSSSSSSLFKR